jgi:hypothetical protein
MRRRPLAAARRLAVLCLLAAGALGGCGYALVGRGSTLPPDVREVYLKPFENGTGRARVDQILTQAVADELVTRQRFAVVASDAGADAELAGTVTGFDVRPVSFDADRRGTEYEIAITARVSLRRVGQTDPAALALWQNDRYQFRDSYKLEASELGFQDREIPAIEAAAQKFAETMITDLLEGF